MLTLDRTEPVFETNANQTGVQKFELVKRGSTSDGKSVYIYRRSFPEGKVFAYEVFVPKVIKAGTVLKFPGGIEKLVEVDTEQYPNGAKTDFGKRAWFCTSLDRAESRFNQLTQIPVAIQEDENEGENDGDNVPPTRGRPKNDRPILTLPVMEFSIKELAEQNRVDYPTAFIFVKELEGAGKVKRTREERRAARGKATQLFMAV